MEARTAAALPAEPGAWQYEPKWDGFRALARKWRGEDALYGKTGKPLARYFPDIEAIVARAALDDFLLDGEMVIDVGGVPSFEALQLRLHPAASRVAKLVAEAPARLVLFDALVLPGGEDITAWPLAKRRTALERILPKLNLGPTVTLSPATTALAEAEAWLATAGEGALDGVVAKRLDEPYRPGKRAMVKVKRLRSADCVVGGFRYLRGGQPGGKRLVGSLLLGLYDDEGRLNHVGHTSTIAADERAALTRRLEKLRGGPGFTGKAPGGPSRWSTAEDSAWEPVKPALVVEVRFDQVTGERFRHGTTLLRWRPDKSPRQCSFDQLKQVKGNLLLLLK
jgi:ATP-dependent DNA ligase